MDARERIPGRNRRRRTGLVSAAGIAVVAAAAVTIPQAFAGEGALWSGAGSGPVAVDDSLLGVVEIGEVTELAESLTYTGEESQIVLHEADASYVKVHFERLLLAEDDFVTVSSPDGAESYTYDRSVFGQWATSITGDTAVVELHRSSGGPLSSALGAMIDRAAYGFPAEVVDSLVEDRADRARPTESVCTADDKRPSPCYASSYPDVVDHADPVARLLIDGTVLCTGFRVGEHNRMLTNNHCLSQNREARATEVWFGYDCTACEGGELTNPIKVDGRQVLATSRELDYTLFSVDDFSAIERFGFLELAEEPVRRGQAIYIPQHPSGRPTEIALTSSVDGGNCVVKDPEYDGYTTGSDVSYYCDTEFGSSGSPVLSRDTHEVVALHHFGGCPNSGVNASIIARELRGLL